MDELMLRCNKNLEELPCCHSDGRQCNCEECCEDDFYNRPDTYNCDKKANYYVLNYGLAYASEIYYYLKYSKVIEENFIDKTVHILSLGCGFAPDLIALSHYVLDYKLPVILKYHGVDKSSSWISARYTHPSAIFTQDDITVNVDLTGIDIVFIVKLFSTLKNNRLSGRFLKVFKEAIATQLKDNGIIVFNDINHYGMGRDLLHREMLNICSRKRQYYFPVEGAWSESGWTEIPETQTFFSAPVGLRFRPLRRLLKTFCFEYRK